MTTVCTFGTFDRLHAGHLSFLEQAKALGDRLVVIVARDEVVEHYKKHHTEQPLSTRLSALNSCLWVDEVLPGDDLAGQGTYAVLATVNADIVAFGYDQTKLRQNFESQQAFRDRIKTVTLEPFKPEIYKTSLLRRDNSV